eukprot:TRINITY_DN75725_c0_g1_i1.p1 TRINITY_DN75725_c0_g1~~TRINITY_DN75725_c0_g1_i1.p1  ORF type:complete len:436 (+),score=63.37 TRINITY_DN75725_c0_g1_i1:57-1364(+)
MARQVHHRSRSQHLSLLPFALVICILLGPRSHQTFLRGPVGRLGSQGTSACGRTPLRTFLRTCAVSQQELADTEVEELLNTANEGKAQATDKKYHPSTDASDPITAALVKVCGCTTVLGYELLDSRWNGNEGFRADTDKGPFFIKMNRVEDVSVFMLEALSLTAIIKTETLQAPKPLHLGKLPKVGPFGPGAFMILDWLSLEPFGAMKSKTQKALGGALAQLHLSTTHDALHKGRFGFPANNFLALTPLNNTWTASWREFLARRLQDQAAALTEEKSYAPAPVRVKADGEDADAVDISSFGSMPTALQESIQEVIDRALPELFPSEEENVKPSLLHGDLWLGNTGSDKVSGPCVFDPACFFGHSEFDLALLELFGGVNEEFHAAYHERIPKTAGFDRRQLVYKLYHYLNQLNLFGDPRVFATCERLCDDILRSLD